ncbi:cytidine deaminase [Coraliomargarita sinensis]|uniref:Cytidine deaminase n=1 Tax=Coraliomargarita sinensis TaxID=2174842 RepID=A0A317ZK56_9BACT|nr:cytidine deaminase [Coraliomargarita sinensis]PXA04328.1 cytidine deaminase [Coraliomargarita sinensis]
MAQDWIDAARSGMGLKIARKLDADILETLVRPQFTGYFEHKFCREEPAREKLITLAREFAVVPISGFQVGALAIGKSGNAYLGANMEFTGVPLHAGLHAEQSAVINAWMHGEPAVEALYVSEIPCGHCRQFLLELHAAEELPIRVRGVQKNLAELMPEPFGRRRAKGQGLLDSSPSEVVKIHPDDGNQTQRAINAASRSYAPYSKSPEGFIIETINGQHFAGRIAESFAFNPSVPAVTTALNQMNLSAQRKVSISSCTQARLATALTQSTAFSEALMRGICNVPVKSVLMESAH